MITDPVELEELRRTTNDLISEDSVEISLSRSVWVRTPAGGTRPGPPEQLEAKRRFFGSVTGDPRYVQYAEGEQVVANYVLVGPYDDDIKEKDEFVVGTSKFKVVEVHPDTSFEVRAWVVEYS